MGLIGYPWSNSRREIVKHLMTVNPLDSVYWQDEGEELLPKDAKEVSGDGGSSFARWFQGGRKLVMVSPESTKMFQQRDFSLSGLPAVLDQKPWKLGYMIGFDSPILYTRSGFAEPPSAKYMFYVEPSIESLGAGVRISGWTYSFGDWRSVMFREHDDDGNRVYRGRQIVDRVTRGSLSALGWTPDWSQDTPHAERIPMEMVRNVVINAFCALHAIPEVYFVPKRKKKGKRKSTVGGVRGVKRLTLNEEGTRLAMTRWEREAGEKRESSTRTVGIHHVDQHHWRVWVSAPKAHEAVMETRVKANGKAQYRVKRLRGPKDGFSRGSGPLKEARAKLVTGIHDL